MTKKYTSDEIKKMSTVSKVEGSAFYEDHLGNMHNIDEDIEQAEKDVELLKQEKNINMRWYLYEIERAKRIAKLKGFSGYQTYLKTSLKQIMDKDEKELGINQ